MAMVRHLDQIRLDKYSAHTEVECTYTVLDFGGRKYLQIDTYGSVTRQEKGKKSQSIRFAPEAIEELRAIINKL